MPILDTNLIDYDVGFDISKLGELKFFANLDKFEEVIITKLKLI